MSRTLYTTDNRSVFFFITFFRTRNVTSVLAPLMSDKTRQTRGLLGGGEERVLRKEDGENDKEKLKVGEVEKQMVGHGMEVYSGWWAKKLRRVIGNDDGSRRGPKKLRRMNGREAGRRVPDSV